MLLHILKKYSAIILLNLFLFAPNISTAAPSDCIQVASDGTVNCLKAKSTFRSIFGGGPITQTFEELRGFSVSTLCAPYSSYPFVCYEQTSLSHPPDPPGRSCSGNFCENFTQEYDRSDNIGGIYTVSYYRVDYGSSYDKRSGIVYHFRSCPVGTVSVNPDPNSSLRYCKPSKPITYAKECAFTNNSGGKLSCKQFSEGQSIVGDPINVATGSKTLVENDYTYNSANPFTFKRYYSHVSNSWKHDYERELTYTNGIQGEIVVLNRPSFQTIAFKKVSGVWSEFRTNYGTKLTQVGNDFIYTNELDEKEYYTNLTGSFDNFTEFNFTSLRKPKGGVFTMTYNLDGTLSKITDIYSNEFNLAYSSTLSGCNNVPKLVSMTGPGGKVVSYTYNTSCRLTKVTFPDTTFKEYIYNSYALTQVKDENGAVHQVTTYASVTGKGYLATSEGLGSTGAIDKITLNYSTANQVTVTDARSNAVIVGVNSANKITGYNTQCTFCNGMQGSSLSYDSNGYVSSVTDFRGNITNYTWNSRGLMLTKTENAGGSLERTTSFTYGNDHNFPLTQTTPVSGGQRVATYTYDSDFNITNVSVTAPKNDGSGLSETRESSFVYDNKGAMTEAFGPRYISGLVNDKISMTYNSTGQVTSITNGLNQTISFSDFDDYGKPQNITDASGRVNVLTYDARGRVLTSTFKSSLLSTDGETTSLTYDNAGLLTQMTTPSGAYKKMFYDTAHRLNKIEEYNESNTYLGKTEFTLDNMSNLTAIKVFNASGAEIRTSTATYDNKNRLFKAIGSLNQTDTYTYDANSNLTQITDAANNVTTKTYDALNRLSSQTNPDTGVVGITYRVDDNIATVTDPKNLVTTYTYNGFGELIKLESPDTGISVITRDRAGNPISYVDARGQSSSMTYDDLNRILSVSYVGAASENVTVVYDSCTNGVGRPCSITDISGTQNYTYNSKGRLATKQYSNGAFTKTVEYGYDNFGRVSSITYPSGKIVNYNYSNDKVLSVSVNIGGITNDIVNNVSYDTFSPNLTSFNWGNGTATYSKVFDKDGLPLEISASNAFPVNKTYGYDSRYNITAINEIGNTSRSSTATYDSKSRITNYNYGLTGNINDYTYNTTDDRLTQKLNGGANTNYNYDANSHRLTSLSGSSTDSMTYDANGNILTASGKTYTYNAANRMLTSNDGSVTTNYLINFMGQRTKKSNSLTTTWFIYDENDNVITEYDINGDLVSEYVYMNDAPIALIRNSNIYYIYTDHLNTPRAITDVNNNLQWTWENKEAFGNNQPDENIGGTQFNFNFRFPGQYFDIETGLNYNINRDYNPVWGRYVTSDPLGLSAGLNTYVYVDGNGLKYSDKLGLLTQIIHVQDNGIMTYDHIAIRVDDIVYSFAPGVIPLGGAYSLGDVRIQSINDFKNMYIKNPKIQLRALTLNLSKSEEDNILIFFAKLNSSKTYYSILGNQCATVANDALNNININNNKFSNSIFKRPINLFEDLANNKKVIKNETYKISDYN